MHRIGLTAARISQPFRNPFVKGEIVPVVFRQPRAATQPVSGHQRMWGSLSSLGSFKKLRRAFSTSAATPPKPSHVNHRRAKSLESTPKRNARAQMEEAFQRRVNDSAYNASLNFKRAIYPEDILSALRAEGLPFSGMAPPSDLHLCQAIRAAGIRAFSDYSAEHIRRSLAGPNLSQQFDIAWALKSRKAEFSGLRVDGAWHPAMRNLPDPEHAAVGIISRTSARRAQIDAQLPQLAKQLRRYVNNLGPVRPAAIASGVARLQVRIGPTTGATEPNSPTGRMFDWVVRNLRAQDPQGAVSASRAASIVNDVFGELDSHMLAGFFGNRPAL